MPRPDRRQSLPALRVPPPLPGAEALRRRLYLAATALGSAVLVSVWVLQLRQGTAEPFVRFGYPAMLVMCGWAAVWLLQGRSLLLAERVVFLVNAVAILAQLGLGLVTPQTPGVDLTSPAYWMLVAVSILSYLIYSTRGGLWFSAGFYLVGVALPWAALALRGEGPGDQPALARVQLTCGAVLLLVYSLAWYRERFMFEHGQRLILEKLANTDPLTGLLNRRALYAAVGKLLEDVRQGESGALILFDLDHFKRVNDAFGHNAGDQVLIGTAELCRGTLRGSDSLGRWGGEEFLIVLPGVTASQAECVAERLRRLVEACTFAEVGRVTASFGVTTCLPGDDLRRCLARADAALYRAKAAGRNRVDTHRDALPLAVGTGDLLGR